LREPLKQLPKNVYSVSKYSCGGQKTHRVPQCVFVIIDAVDGGTSYRRLLSPIFVFFRVIHSVLFLHRLSTERVAVAAPLVDDDDDDDDSSDPLPGGWIQYGPNSLQSYIGIDMALAPGFVSIP
jgi:hypothetical protein